MPPPQVRRPSRQLELQEATAHCGNLEVTLTGILTRDEARGFTRRRSWPLPRTPDGYSVSGL